MMTTGTNVHFFIVIVSPHFKHFVAGLQNTQVIGENVKLYRLTFCADVCARKLTMTTVAIGWVFGVFAHTYRTTFLRSGKRHWSNVCTFMRAVAKWLASRLAAGTIKVFLPNV
jgi:hypothetical protein